MIEAIISISLTLQCSSECPYNVIMGKKKKKKKTLSGIKPFFVISKNMFRN